MMNAVLQAVLLTTMLSTIPNAQEILDDTEACSNPTVISDRKRLYSYSQTLDSCDSDLAQGWYKFEINGTAAEIPTTCLKNELCGTQLPMRLDLDGKTLPDSNSTMRAYVCTSFNVLSRWDCCVLRQRAGIRNCGNFYVYYLSPTDRCNVGYCIQEAGENPPKEYIVKTGDLVANGTTAVDSTTSSPKGEAADGMNVTLPTTTVASAGVGSLCNLTSGYPCFGGYRTCYNTTTGQLIACSDGLGCHTPCDNIPGCEDRSDENVCSFVSCPEGRRLCPNEDSCFTLCDGKQDCIDGYDERDCGPTEESKTGSVSSTLLLGPSVSFVTNLFPETQSLEYSSTNVSTRSHFEDLSLSSLEIQTLISVTESAEMTRTLTNIQTTYFSHGDATKSTSDLLGESENLPSHLSHSAVMSAFVGSSVMTPLIKPSSLFFQTFIAESVISSTPSLPTTLQDTAFTSSSFGTKFYPGSRISTSILSTQNTSSAQFNVSIVSSRVDRSLPQLSYDSVSSSVISLSSMESNEAISTEVTTESVTYPVEETSPGSVDNSTDTFVRGPITLTFDIIGTAYRNAEERLQEPTFEEILKKLITDALNEYSYRDRRAVQNFTEEHVQIQGVTKSMENASVTFSVHSTLTGEDYVPLEELETIFNNKSIVNSLCNKLFGDSSEIYTRQMSEPSSLDITYLKLTPPSTFHHVPSSMLDQHSGQEHSTPLSVTSTSESLSSSTAFITRGISTNTESLSLSGGLSVRASLTTRAISSSSLQSNAKSATLPNAFSVSDLDVSFTPVTSSQLISSMVSERVTSSPMLDISSRGKSTVDDSTSLVSSFGISYPSVTDQLEQNKTFSFPQASESEGISPTMFPTSEQVFLTPSSKSSMLPPDSERTSLVTLYPDEETTSSAIYSQTKTTMEATSVSSHLLLSSHLPAFWLSQTDSFLFVSKFVSSFTSFVDRQKLSSAVIVSETSLLSLSASPTISVFSPSQANTEYTYALETDIITRSTQGQTTISSETFTVTSATDGNLTLESPTATREKVLFEENFGLFIFLIVAGSCICGTCVFVLVAKLYKQRRYTWDPRLAYQNAYADMEKADLSYRRDVPGIESPIPDIDILNGESNEQELSLSKASTMTLPRTPKNEASQTDNIMEPGPSNEPDLIGHSSLASSSLHNVNTPNGGQENKGFETDTDSGVDGIVPIDEIDNADPRKSFPWMDQLADTRL